MREIRLETLQADRRTKGEEHCLASRRLKASTIRIMEDYCQIHAT
jgi:hypothetical protein